MGGVRGRGRAWQGGACVAGGVRGREGRVWQGACVAGGVHGRGCAWQGGRAWQILRDTINERAVRILLELKL